MVDFLNSSHETLFHSLKYTTLVHGKVVDLDILSPLDCPIKPFFEFQGWANIFFIPMKVYEPLIRLFYANHRSPKAAEIKSLVLGRHIFLDCKKVDSIFDISCSGIMDPPKTIDPLSVLPPLIRPSVNLILIPLLLVLPILVRKISRLRLGWSLILFPPLFFQGLGLTQLYISVWHMLM